MQNSLCIGLFGTCGKSTWRKPFIEQYKEDEVNYFNPQVEDWKPECAVEEAWHLANDEIVLFPITSETYAVGSLAETGFSMLQAMKINDRRDIVFLIEQRLDDELMQDKDRAKESLRARALVMEHMKRCDLPNVYLVESLEQMLNTSLVLYASRCVASDVKQHSLKSRFHNPREDQK